ncbi:MAG: Crp/Fnr family transcriptional regulator [Chitinophagaceae bacterium]|nr:Crp/Fnr family transcriptional regulator [Chitinophagaceae bacterium]MCW5925302.1 Crp/Fnr family transcriptional regulator [Chitinophagaceae bacterium]
MTEALNTYLNEFTGTFEQELLEELAGRAMLLNVSGGEVMINPDQPVLSVPLVLRGTFKVARITDEGQEVLLYYVKSGESCAMLLTFWMTTKVSVVKAVAEEDSVLLCLPLAVADEWLIRYPSWKKFVMNTILDGFSGVIKSIDDVLFKKMDVRLVNYLKNKSKITNSTLINLTHQQISDDLGTNRVVVSRILKDLENRKKVLLYRNQIKLLRDL